MYFFFLPESVLKTKWKGLRDNFRVEYKRIPRAPTGELLTPPQLFESKWICYKPLLFLVDHLRARNPNNSVLYPPNPTGTLGDNTNDIYEDDEEDTSDYIQIPETLPKMATLSPPALTLPASNGTAASTAASPTTTVKNGACTPPLPPLVPVSMPTIKPISLKRLREDSVERVQSPEMSISPKPSLDGLDDDFHFLMSLHPFMNQMSNAQKLKTRLKIQKLIFKELFKDEDVDEAK